MQSKGDKEMTNGFKRGSGCYKCGVCGKLTRSTGRGDNENNGTCARCFDMSGDENAVLDGEMSKDEFKARWGYDVDTWDKVLREEVKASRA
jgi:hypothetical protein